MVYYHLRDKSTLKVGEVVKTGQVIGTMGSTGTATGAHLHFGIKQDDRWIDPTPYLDADFIKATRETKKICIDAGHYGSKYNRSPVVRSYYESVMNWKLHLLLKKYLEEYGFEVITTRKNRDKDLGLTTRGKASKGCDLFLSIHSNACDTESVDHPVVFVPLNGTGDVLGKKLADCIAATMGTRQKGTIASKKGKNGDYYGVIRGAVSVDVTGLILEHSFHTNTKSANWLLNDDNLDKMAKAEAKVIAEHYGMEKQLEAPKDEFKPYLVKITASALNVRAGAGTSHKINTVVKKNEVFTIVAEKGNWGKLKSGAGWISLKYCKKL
jgi:N-acetylmuramoyl-L-alanine amidase